MIQEIYPYKLVNGYDPGASPGPEDTLIAFGDGGIICRIEDEKLVFPKVGEIPVSGNVVYAFRIENEEDPGFSEKFFLSLEKEEVPGGYETKDAWGVRASVLVNKYSLLVMFTATHLMHWYGANRFCGKCGHPTVHSEKERAMVCPECRNTIYPKLLPAVIIGVTRGDELLVTKYGDRDLPFFVLVAGFVEIGESLEECVKREVKEECGIDVTDVTYYKSQPWGVVDDILSGFYCRAADDAEPVLDQQELKDYLWAKRGEVPLMQDEYSLTSEMMRAWNEGYEPYRKD